MAEWLTAVAAAQMLDIGDEVLPGGEPVPSWEAAVDAAASFVADRRTDVDYDLPVPAQLRLGTAQLAQRWYDARTRAGFAEVSGGITAELNDDLRQMLGIAQWRPPVVGGAPRPAGGGYYWWP